MFMMGDGVIDQRDLWPAIMLRERREIDHMRNIEIHLFSEVRIVNHLREILGLILVMRISLRPHDHFSRHLCSLLLNAGVLPCSSGFIHLPVVALHIGDLLLCLLFEISLASKPSDRPAAKSTSEK
jgi:hypothetical protein